MIRVKSDLPYDHARHSDMQVRNARSRLAFILLYLIVPVAALVFFFGIFLIYIYSPTFSARKVIPKNVQHFLSADSIVWLVVLIEGKAGEASFKLDSYMVVISMIFCHLTP